MIGITVTDGHTELVKRYIEVALQKVSEWLPALFLVGMVKYTIGRNSTTQLKGLAFAQGLQVDCLGQCYGNKKEK